MHTTRVEECRRNVPVARTHVSVRYHYDDDDANMQTAKRLMVWWGDRMSELKQDAYE